MSVLYVIKTKNKQKEWHPATKPLKKKNSKENLDFFCWCLEGQ
jgi:hypothetical protein